MTELQETPQETPQELVDRHGIPGAVVGVAEDRRIEAEESPT